MIHPQDISFVVQGPIVHEESFNTLLVLKSIRKHYKGATIILSTWDTENTNELDYDLLVKQQAPEVLNTVYSEQCNVNRLLVSSQHGLEKVKTPYAVKTRTDIVFTSSHLCGFQFDDKAVLFESKIVLLNYFSRNPYKQFVKHGIGLLFHPSDIFLFGKTKAVQKFFSAERAETSILNNINGNAPIFPEQYLLMSLLIREGLLIDYHNSRLKSNSEFTHLSEKIFIENFKIHNPNQLGITIPKRIISGWHADSIYTENELIKSKYFSILKAIYYCKIYPIFVKIKKLANDKNQSRIV